jgi:hypothetical protein
MNQARENSRPLKLENGRTIFRRRLKVNRFGSALRSVPADSKLNSSHL